MAAYATLDQVAKALNITKRRVNQLADEGALPREGRGKYNLGKCMLAYIRYLQNALNTRSTQGDDGEVRSLQTERTGLVRIQREREEFDLDVERKKYIPADVIEATWMKLATVVKTNVLGWSSKAKQIMPHLSDEDVDNLDKIARETLEELACQPSSE